MIRTLLAALLLGLVGCSVPPQLEGDGPSTEPATARAPSSLRVVNDLVRTVQLYESSQEVSLPVVTLGSPQTLTLAFDRLTESPGAVQVSFRHLDLGGPSNLLPTEYLSGFERDDILGYQTSGATAVPYVHYEYTFPNARVGFRLSGNYELTVTDSGTGAELFSAPFYVVEQSAEVQLAFGTTLLDGAVGNAIQPAARLSPGARLADYDAFQYTVCFARNGRLDDVRCAPEPRLIDLAQFQFYLPRTEAFRPAPPLYEMDLGGLTTSTEVVDVDRSARPPTALLDLDYAAFGGEVRDAVLATTPLIDGAFVDPGVAETDAEYVEVGFRYVPPDERRLSGPVNVVGTFSGWKAMPGSELTWNPEGKRYEGTLLLKQGLYVYEYVIPRLAAANVLAIGQPNLFTAFVYLRDPQLFADRLVAVQSGIAR